MKKNYKTDELEGALLDAAVARANGWDLFPQEQDGHGVLWVVGTNKAAPAMPCPVMVILKDVETVQSDARWQPTKNWAQGGPLLDTHPWALPRRSIGARHHLGAFSASTPGGFEHNGPTPLIAAMRAFVANKFGDEVELPV